MNIAKILPTRHKQNQQQSIGKYKNEMITSQRLPENFHGNAPFQYTCTYVFSLVPAYEFDGSSNI